MSSQNNERKMSLDDSQPMECNVSNEIKSLGDEDDEDDAIITLISNDKINFKIKKSCIYIKNKPETKSYDTEYKERAPKTICGLVKVMCDTDPYEQKFNLNVNSECLKIIVEHLITWGGNTPPLPKKPLTSSNLKENGCDQKDIDLLNNIPMNSLCELIQAANYMECMFFLEICCSKVASFLKGKPVTEFRKILGDVNE